MLVLMCFDVLDGGTDAIRAAVAVVRERC